MWHKIFKINFLLVLAVAMLAAGCSSSDDDLCFTQDEIVGDINTGKQVPVASHLTVTCPTVLRVNISNAHQPVAIVIGDPKVVSVEANAQANRPVEMIITVKAPGESTIKVTDKKGRTATLTITSRLPNPDDGNNTEL